MLIGDQEGINLWNKLANHSDSAIQAYFRSLNQAAEKYQKFWFSDFDEQRKKKLNNQKMFFMFYNEKTQNWVVELFLTPIKEGE